MTKLLTPQEVSETLGIAEQTLANWRCQKIHLPYTKPGGRVRYDAADVEHWLQSNRHTPSVQALVEKNSVRI